MLFSVSWRFIPVNFDLLVVVSTGGVGLQNFISIAGLRTTVNNRVIDSVELGHLNHVR